MAPESNNEAITKPARHPALFDALLPTVKTAFILYSSKHLALTQHFTD
jgi:hypothetical protein